MKPAFASSNSVLTSHREWLLAVALLAVGIVLRWWVASRSAVEHFDEGVYASNLFFNEPPYSYPMQHLYAPPLLPSLIEAGMIAGLPPNLAAILPGLIAGCLTLIVVWRMARWWFGPAAGLSALALASLNDFHVAYTSTALTDVLLTLFVLLAVAATARALASATGGASDPVQEQLAPTRPPATTSKRRGKRVTETQPILAGSTGASRWENPIGKWAVIAGLVTAAAWWTKYNGWLPLAIALAGSGLLLWISPTARAGWRRIALVLALIVAVTAIAWSPVPLRLSDVGGYGAVAANHAKYVVGPAGWVGSALRQIANQSAMEGVLSWLSLPVALLVAWVSSSRVYPALARREIVGRPLLLLGGMVALATAAVVESTFVVLVALSLSAVAIHAMTLLRRGGERAPRESTIGFCLLAAWLFGLLIATPNYWPYPRLAMPLLACLWSAAGFSLSLVVQTLTQPVEQASVVPTGRWTLPVAIAVGLVIALPIVYFGRSPIRSIGGSLSIDRTSMARAANEIATRIRSDLKQNQEEPFCLVFVQAEPALIFQLRAAGLPIVRPVIAPPPTAVMIDDRQLPTYFVFGPHADGDPQFVAQWPAQKSGFNELDGPATEIQPSNVVWLDSHDPRRETPQLAPITVVRRK